MATIFGRGETDCAGSVAVVSCVQTTNGGTNFFKLQAPFISNRCEKRGRELGLINKASPNLTRLPALSGCSRDVNTFFHLRIRKVVLWPNDFLLFSHQYRNIIIVVISRKWRSSLITGNHTGMSFRSVPSSHSPSVQTALGALLLLLRQLSVQSVFQLHDRRRPFSDLGLDLPMQILPETPVLIAGFPIDHLPIFERSVNAAIRCAPVRGSSAPANRPFHQSRFAGEQRRPKEATHNIAIIISRSS
jgi:hypothetical protein